MRSYLLLVFLLTASINAFAIPITFVHTGTGSGSIGATNFTNADFTITAVGDTDNRQWQGAKWIDHDSVSISITGVGSALFSTATRTFLNGSTVGFSRAGASGLDLYNGPNNGTLSGWDMLSGIGPVSGIASLMQWTISPVNTDLGILNFARESGIDATFRATTGSTVPEPATVALMAFGFIGIGLGRRKAKQQR